MKQNKGIRISDIVFSLLILLGLGLTLAAAAAGGHLFSKKILAAHLFLLILLLVSLFREKLFGKLPAPQAGHRLQTAAGILLLILTPAAQLFFTQLGVFSSLNLETPYIFYGILLYAFLLLFLFFLLGKASWAGALTSFIALFLLLVDYFVSNFRGRPFTVMDVVGARTAMNVMENYTMTMSIEMVLLSDCFFLLMIVNWFWQPLAIRGGKKSIPVRCGGAAAVAAAAALFINFVVIAQDFSTARLFNPAKTYGRYGYLFVMIAETSYLHVEAPEGYDPQNVADRTAEILDVADSAETKAESEVGADTAAEPESEAIADAIVELETEAATDTVAEPETESGTATAIGTAAESEIGAGDSSEKIIPENIIVIMNESLADMSAIGNLKTDSPILPYLHSLQENVTKGNLYVHVFGGGTADTEYEFLTGNSKQFLPEGMVAYEAYTHEPEYGLVTTLKSYGYKAVAMHPNRGTNWNREKVYERMQFDEFYTRENWPIDMELIRSYDSDRNLYDAVCELIDGKEEGQRFFTFCVSMQNHGGYTKKTWTNGFEPTVKLKYKKTYNKAETYLTLANESDSAFEYLTDIFSNSDQNTMIVMFGDHLPYVEDSFYKKLFGKKIEDLEFGEHMLQYQVPYVIWTNYERESREEDMSSNYLGSVMLKEANLDGTPYNDLILEEKETVPIIGLNTLGDGKGKWYRVDDAPADMAAALDEYWAFEYNQIFDRKNLVTEAFTMLQSNG